MGIAPIIAMIPSSHHGAIIYPCSNPQLKAAPPNAGPIARPTADIETANPFNVPRILRLTAEFVSRMIEHGNAKMTAKLLTTMMPKIAACCQDELTMSAVYGVAKHIIGNVTAQHLKQFSTPKWRAVGGKIRNWTKPPQMPYIVNKVPMRPDSRPKPPQNLNGRYVFAGVCSSTG